MYVEVVKTRLEFVSFGLRMYINIERMGRKSLLSETKSRKEED
jgi:hypothetical protein